MQVEQTLRRVGRLGPALDDLAAAAAAAGGASGGAVAPTVGCVETSGYRNKVRQAARATWGSTACCLA